MNDNGDYLLVSVGSAYVRVWVTHGGHLSCHTAATPDAVVALLHHCNTSHDFDAAAQMLQTVLAPLFVCTSSHVVLLTNADDSPHFWAHTQRWMTQRTACPPAQIHLMAQALFTAHLLAMPTGIIVDVGHHATRVTPACDGFLVASGVSSTVGMDVVATVDHESLHTLLQDYLHVQRAPDVNAEDSPQVRALQSHSNFTRILYLVDGIQEAIEKTVVEVKRLGLAACLSHVVLTGGGMNCEALRDIVCCHLYALAPQARVHWE